MPSRFVAQRRRKLRSSLRYSGLLLLVAGFLLAAGVGPLYFRWWDAALPAAITSAIAALLLLAVAVNVPLEAFPYVSIYADPESRERRPWPPRGFGRTLYRESAQWDAIARAGGLTPLSEFASADPLDTHRAPAWHEPEIALPTVEHLLARADPRLKPHLEYLRAELQAMSARGAKFYFLVTTLAGGTNARVEALRHGDTSVIAPR